MPNVQPRKVVLLLDADRAGRFLQREKNLGFGKVLGSETG